MDFKRVLFLKKQMARKMNGKLPELSEQDVFSIDALTLAYMGDACWSLFVRNHLIGTGIHNVQILNSLASEMVSAKWQSQILEELEELLNDRELMVIKRGRNTKSAVPKSATVHEYRLATAFEALLGYLFLSHQEDRIEFIMNRSLSYLAREFNHEG